MTASWFKLYDDFYVPIEYVKTGKVYKELRLDPKNMKTA